MQTAYWVFCEGKSEETCLKQLRAHWRLPAVSVEVVGEVGTPWTVVQRAKEKRDELRRTGEKGWTVFAVFDRDEHPKFDEAIARAAAIEGIELGVSVPCFELWALLLHRDQTAHIERDSAQRDLKEIHPGYCHQKHPFLNLEVVLAGLGDAAARAAVLERRAKEAGDAFGNPTTTFGKVIEAIRPPVATLLPGPE